MKDKVINDLLKRISDLEFEVERLEKVIKVKDEGFKASTEDLCEESTKIDKAIEYINNCSLPTTTNEYILSPNHLIDILKGVDE